MTCEHKRYTVDVQDQTGRCNNCGAEGRMCFVVCDPVAEAVAAEREACAAFSRESEAENLLREWFYADAFFKMDDWNKRTRDFFEDRDHEAELESNPQLGKDMAELGKILKMTADRDRKDALNAAIEVCKKRELIGMDLMMVMAAAVELTEPTP